MYFHRVSNSSPGVIGRATAPGPAGPWQADLEPVLLPGGEGTWDAAGLEWPSVQTTPDGLVMYYSGRPTSLGHRMIGRATSQDGIVWEKYDDLSTMEALFAESDPVFAASEPWATTGVDRARVQLTPEGWVMVYQSGALVKRGLAFSPDGIRWVSHPNNPVLELEDFPFSGNMWDTNLLYHDGTFYYYTELGTMAGTDIYLAIHEGEIVPEGLELPEPAPIVTPQEPATGLPAGVILLDAASLLADPGGDPLFTSHLDTNIIRLGTYTLGAGVEDPQPAHNEDEVYYVIEGEATLNVDGEKVPVSTGALFYIHAGTPHQFEDITQDLQVLAFSSKRGPSEEDPAWLGFELGALLAGLEAGAGENAFLDAATLDGRLVSLAPGEIVSLEGGSRAVYLAVQGAGEVLVGESGAGITDGTLLYFPRELPATLQAGEEGLILLEIAATE
jgi:mannose-6-phosphate isomerase-like protein (cupin superfamily)